LWYSPATCEVLVFHLPSLQDWPVVQSLGRQLLERNDPRCLLHLTSSESIMAAWFQASPDDRARMTARRPLLRVLQAEPHPARLELERLLALERLVWQRFNHHRYEQYASAWKRFFREWRREDDWEWPTSEPFWLQHQRVAEAAGRHGLPENPLEDRPPDQLLEAALEEVTALARATEEELAKVLPPVNELLP
jgi:hypothetical protein